MDSIVRCKGWKVVGSQIVGYEMEDWAVAKEEIKQIALRDNKGKPEMHYWDLFPKVAEAFSRVMEYGGSKYEYLNFAKGGKPDQEYLDAARRHHIAHCKRYISGDQTDMYDTESGCLHLAHELFNLFALIEYNLGELPVRNIDESD